MLREEQIGSKIEEIAEREGLELEFMSDEDFDKLEKRAILELKKNK